MVGIGMKMKSAKSLFLDSKRVTRAVDKVERKKFTIAGSFIRTRSRQSIKKPRRARLSDLPPEERKKYEPKRDKTTGRFTEQKTKDGKKRKLPFASSKPGDPPFYHTKAIKLIFFVYDPRRHSVIIGPVKLSGKEYPDEPSMLEWGGHTVRRGKSAHYKARPFMRPAMEAEEDNIQERWRNSIRR